MSRSRLGLGRKGLVHIPEWKFYLKSEHGPMCVTQRVARVRLRQLKLVSLAVNVLLLRSRLL